MADRGGGYGFAQVRLGRIPTRPVHGPPVRPGGN